MFFIFILKPPKNKIKSDSQDRTKRPKIIPAALRPRLGGGLRCLGSVKISIRYTDLLPFWCEKSENKKVRKYTNRQERENTLMCCEALN